jgi:5-methyltetrahydrofolate--homocysteine methyltransferase
MRQDLRERLGKEWLFFDGGMGTLLQAKGLAGGELPEKWNLTHPEVIIEIAENYLNAGADIFNTNTFGANRLKYPDSLEEIVTAGVNLAKEARRRAGREEDAYIALDIGSTGKLLEPMGDLSFDRAVELFGEVVRIGASAGADLVLIETMSDSYEAKAAVLAAKENCDLPVLITTIYDGTGKLLTGGTVDSTVPMLEGFGVDALGVNCGLGPEQMYTIAKRLTEVASVPIIVTPNAGLPRQEDGRTVYDVDPDEFADWMGRIADLGVQLLGGCCGTTPEYIEKMVKTVRPKPFRANTPKHRTVVTSFSKAVVIDNKPVIIGERINPTGKKKFKQALRDHDLDYICSQGLQQEDAGADILDVNVGLPEIDEPKMMREVILQLQGICALPLQIDTTDRNALETALRHYNGKAMVNSVNGKREEIEKVMPLVKKYGGVLVGLCIDEDGIPGTAEGRIRIARKIYDAAEEYGIPREDIIIDGLTMTISSDSTAALTTLETVRRVRDELGGHSILGVSNISFGLPQRQLINANFFTMAMQNGLSAAIINPNNADMMAAYRSFLALTNQDPQCLSYIDAYANAAPVSLAPAAGTIAPNSGTAGAVGAGAGTPAPGASSGGDADTAEELIRDVERGMAGQAAAAAKALIDAGKDPMEIINEQLIPALDVVGKGFEKGTIFLPQLLMSSEAAQAGFGVIREAMKGTPRESKGKIILATVKGDIHDIGKNIVKVLLENYGYQVIDLGKDVPPEKIVKTALDEDVKLVGLSALMTTTVVSMKETIRQLRIAKPDTKVMVGGAVLTQEYADQIGADAYAKDAMESVRYADSLDLMH